MEENFEFDDVLIKPIPSKISSRDAVDISVRLSNSLTLNFPLIASPMVGVVDGRFANLLFELGGLAILHRFYKSRAHLIGDIESWLLPSVNFGISIRIGEDDIEEYFQHYPKIILVDTANGYTKRLKDYCEIVKNKIVKENMPILLMAGNVATHDGCLDLYNSGCDIIRIGIGGGSLCSTRNQTGIGVPSISSILDCSRSDLKLVIDGGIRNSGDFVKAIAAGATLGMSGKLFAECYESPNEGVLYGMACYDEKTEILTKQGWKNHRDITYDDLFATLNPNTHSLEYQKPLKIHNYNYSGDMVSIKSKIFDILVTKNHELYLAKNKQKHKNYIYRKVFAENIIGKGINFFKKDFDNWEGIDTKYFSEIDGYSFNMKEWLWLFGFYLAEGNTRKFVNKTGNICYIMSISNTDYSLIKKCMMFFDANNIKYSIRERKIKSGKTSYEISSSNKYLAEYLIQFKNSLEKFVPSYIKELSVENIKSFISGFNDGDGSKTKKCLYTSSEFLRDDLYELLLKIGYTPSIYIINKKNSLYKNFKRNHDSYGISYGKRKKPIQTTQENYSLESYSGSVWCVEIPNGIVYVRRNFKSVWCGNSRTHMENTKANIKSVEGFDTVIKKKHSLEQFVREFGYGIKSAGTYLNARNLNEIYLNSEFVKVSDHSIKKGL